MKRSLRPVRLAGFVASASLALLVPTSAFAADVTTIAGNGLAGISGDGGPATAAALNSPDDVAVAADGTVYIADAGNLRIRRISPGGVISTIAGNGDYGDAGDGGQATAAELGSIEAIALSPADDVLYISDGGTNRVRRVDLASGVITTFAGRGLDYIGHTGNGGPATDAWIGIPRGLAVDPTGNVYFTETMYCTVRKVDIATQVITRVAGSSLPNDCASDGDGGTALAAHLGSPNSLAADAAGNLFVVDTSADTVRRIDAVTHIITTIAGGGVTLPGFGDATTMDLGEIEGLAIDDADDLYVSNFNRVFKVDLDTGSLSVYAGSGASGFSGDGGNALDATFSSIWGVDIRASTLFIADQNNNRIRAVVPPPPPDDLVIESGTLQEILDSVNVVVGSILMINVDGREYLLIPNATSVGLDVTLTGNDQLLVVDLGALQSVGGSITISGNLVMESVDLGSLATVDGSLTVTGNPALNAILISGVTSIGGDFMVAGTAATVIDLSALTTMGGSLTASNNASMSSLDLGALTTVGVNLDASRNASMSSLDLGALTTVGSSIDVSENATLSSLDLGALTTVGGAIYAGENAAVISLDLGALTTVGDSIDASYNASMTSLDLGALTTVGDTIDASNNASMTSLDLGALTTVGGSIDASENASMSSIDMSALTTVGRSLHVSGNTAATSIDMIALTTVGHSLDVSGNASMSSIDMSAITTVGGDLEVSGNTSATTIDMSSTTTVGGDITVVDNGDASVDMSAGTDVGGDLTVETTGTGAFDMGDGTVTGDVTLDATGYTDMSGNTPVGSLDLTATRTEAVMHLQIQAATFATPVAFTVTRVDPVTLASESGLDAGGDPATIDPIAAYQFDFEVPTLDRDATLSFDIVLAQLDATTRADLLDALDAGTATLVTKGDGAGSSFQAFPVCGSADTPTAGGCVQVETFDAGRAAHHRYAGQRALQWRDRPLLHLGRGGNH